MKFRPLLLQAFPSRKFLQALALAGLCAISSASAQLSWDPGSTGGPAGGTGAWNTTSNFWWDGNANVPWVNGSSNNASFAGTAGTVTLGTAVSAGTLNFTTAGYTIDLNANNLTLTGLSGSAATFRNTNTNAATLTANMSADTVWGGNLGSAADRLNITVTGGRSLTVNQVIRDGGGFQQTLTISGSGTKLALSGTGSTFTGNIVSISGGATFDLGSNGNFAARRITLDATSTITATGTARIIDNNSNEATSLAGFLTGTLAVQQSDGNNAMTISNNGNTYSGGTTITTGEIIATANNALGTGAVELSNTAGNATLRMRSAAPVIGSLSSSGAGSKFLVLGNTAIDTNLTINQTVNGTFGGVISEFAGQTGSLTKTGAQTLTLSAVNTYTGDTTISDGGLTLSGTSELRFRLANGGVSNRILGTGILTANGLFRLDITGLTASTGTWNLVNAATLTDSYGGTFGLAFVGGPTFTNAGGGVYTSGDWTFTTADGNLVLVPEPSTALLLLGGLGAIAAFRRSRKLRS